MNNWILWLFLGAWIIGPLIASAGTFYKLLISWRVPTTWISALPTQGFVEVLGRVRSDPIKSLLNQSDCAYWQFEVKEYQSGGKGGGRWKTIHKQSSGSLLIDDMTGRVQILEGNPAIITNYETVLEKPDAKTKAFLENHDIKTKGFLGFDKRLRVYERLVSPTDEILILGKAQKNTTPTTISGIDIVPFVISNMGRAQTNKTLLIQAVRPMILPYLVGIGFLIFYLYIMFK
jgi:hypothetical protein